MEFKELIEFIDQEDKRLNKYYHDHTDKDKHILARTVKLNEEVGELCNEVLSHTHFQRKQKLDACNKENLPDEFADVILTTLLLARSMDVDVEEALTEKIKKIKARNYELPV